MGFFFVSQCGCFVSLWSLFLFDLYLPRQIIKKQILIYDASLASPGCLVPLYSFFFSLCVVVLCLFVVIWLTIKKWLKKKRHPRETLVQAHTLHNILQVFDLDKAIGINFQQRASSLFSICLSIYLSIRSPESSCRMDGVYLSCHMGSLITPALCYQTCRQTAVLQRIPPRLPQTAQHSDNEPRLTSVHITAAISPVIIKLHGAVRQIHINERSGALDLAKLNASALTLATVPTFRKWCSTWTLIIWDVIKTQTSAEWDTGYMKYIYIYETSDMV